MSDFDVEKVLHSQIRRAVIAWEEGGGDIEVILKSRLAGYRPPALPASKETSSDKFDVMKSFLLDLPATRTHGVFTPSTEWVRIMVGYAMTTAVDRKMSVEDARQEGYAWFDRWIAAVSGERSRDFMAEVESDVSVANEIV